MQIFIYEFCYVVIIIILVKTEVQRKSNIDEYYIRVTDGFTQQMGIRNRLFFFK